MKKAFIGIFLLLISNVFGMYYSLYMKWAWFDTTQHFLGGFFVAMLMADYLKKRLTDKNRGTEDIRSLAQDILIVVGVAVFIGVVWEFAEYVANKTLMDSFYEWFKIRVYFMGDLDDTVKDLLMDTLGALSLMASHFLSMRKTNTTERI